MEREKELNEEILKIIVRINKFYPELTKFMGELPIKISDDADQEITIRNLQEYHDSLTQLVDNYVLEHGGNHSEYEKTN